MTWIKLDDNAARRTYCLEHHDWHMPAFLYVLSTREHPELVKVGIAASPNGRVSKLQITSPLTLVLLTKREACCRSQARLTEQAIHHRFSSNHVHTEWFRLSPEQIAQLVADVEAL